MEFELIDCRRRSPLLVIAGVNGCSLKTDANLAVVASLPAERLLLETDAPWCGIRPSHASSRMVQTKFLEKDKKQYRPDILVKGADIAWPCSRRGSIPVRKSIAGSHGFMQHFGQDVHVSDSSGC